ncbi:MAG: UDP-glucose 6-dehydrogenase [uncultured Chloroflexi bacterium]|uniref:UDP-glucose 6-dehydrogenase n=1 Tax=uncultured Chloroflexota bacterium TaxID=166587 RepID=A0A6J4K0Y8_9CHLR|nr:MAG: UDP-glucose 6-dehydrogenase [uncultured Chloroflexota bacterium]
MKQICVVGTGYVGLVTGTCFADLGNRVVCLDIDEGKVARLRRGELPIFEPGLEELVARNVAAGRLSFTTSYAEAVPDADYCFIAVPTPSGAEGEADLGYVRAAAATLALYLKDGAVIVNKSTVPIGTADRVDHIVERHLPAERRGSGPDGSFRFGVVSNPEFLREGAAVADFMKPDRVVLGATRRADAERVAELYASLKCPVLVTDPRTAEMIKYASNAFLATKISFINEVASICERLGADVRLVAEGMGRDARIGRAFLDAGLGWGGSCFPKDVKALAHMAALSGCHPQLLRTVIEINKDQRLKVIQKLRDALGGPDGSLEGQTVALLGLAFKPNTDDLREAPALEIAHLLLGEGVSLRAYDPVAMPGAQRLLPEVHFATDAYDCVAGADAAVIVTDWNEFKQLDLAALRRRMSRPVLVDGRNIYEPAAVRAAGFLYFPIGRGTPEVVK